MEISIIKTSWNLKLTTLSSIQIQLLKSWTLLFWKLSSMETSEKLKPRRLSYIQIQFLKSWTLSFCDNVMGHMLVHKRRGDGCWCKKGNHLAWPQGKKCQLADFQQKRKVWGMTSSALYNERHNSVFIVLTFNVFNINIYSYISPNC